MLQARIARWVEHAVRHLPAAASNPLDFRFCGLSDENRWNARGDPTLYLAQDAAVAYAEFARHVALRRAMGLAPCLAARRLFRLTLAIERTLDLRDEGVLAALSIRDAPGCFLDPDFCRATASFIRRTTDAQAVVVPSFALLGDTGHWVLAVFLEKLQGGPLACISMAEPAGHFALG